MNEQDHSGRSRPKSLISDESMFCAGHLSGGADTCKQDSGGPAVAEINGKATLVGKSDLRKKVDAYYKSCPSKKGNFLEHL